LVRHRVQEQARLGPTSDEDPLHRSFVIENQRANEPPVARVVEEEEAAGGTAARPLRCPVLDRVAEAVVREPAATELRAAGGVGDVEDEVGVETGPMAPVAR